LIIIGVIIVVLAPVWKWAIAPQVVKLPDNLDVTSIYEGALSLYIDPASLSPLPPDTPVRIPLTITRKDISDPAKSNGSTAVIKETAVAKGPGGKDFVNYTKYYALDRKTAKNVTSSQANLTNRRGYSITMGFFVNKNGVFPFWDDDTETVTNLQFIKTDTMSGFKYKDIPVVVFKAQGSGKTKSPPLGLPATVSGSQIKGLLNNTSAPFNDTQQYPIDYIKSITATVIVDQKAGSIVDLPKYNETYSVDASALGMGNIKLASLDYAQTPESIKDVLDNSAKSYMLLNAVEIWIPVALLVIGLIILIIGLILYLRKPKEKAAA
jgi:hypothetical protein